MGKPVEVREFDTITCNADFKDDDNFIHIAKKDFDSLTSFIHEFAGTEENADALEFMKIEYRRNVGEVISFKNYVGLIQTKSGFQIQVLPKISFGDGEDKCNEQTKRIFLKMLRSMKNFPSKVLHDASLKVDRMNLYEIFINMYLQEVRQLVKHGIRSSYVQQEDNLKFYKGKLLVRNHLRANLVHRERFYVSFEEFHPNRPENRLVKATLEKLQKLTTSAENSKEIRQLLTAFEMVESSTNYEKDFSKVTLNRTTKDYELLMLWSRVFLQNKSFTTFSGSTTSKALLFPMESVYESYVAQQMKKVFIPDGWEVSCQDKGYYLFVEPTSKFALRPDIVLKREGRTIIMDTKWKRLIDSERKNYGISQTDMYQMYAYSKKYETSEIWLLYPVNDEMRGHKDISFESGDGTVVRIHFVDVTNTEENLIELKRKIEEATRDGSSKFDNLLSFIPVLKDDGFGEWIIDHKNDGTQKHPIQFPFVSYSESVIELEHAIYEFKQDNPDYELDHYGEILNENGIEWSTQSMEAADVSRLNAQAVMALLLGAVRAERFCDGALLGFWKSGAMLRWLERLQEIVEKG